MKKTGKDRKGKQNSSNDKKTGKNQNKDPPKLFQPRPEKGVEHYSRCENVEETAVTHAVPTNYKFQINVKSAFTTTLPIILNYKTMATTLPPKSTQTILDQVLSLPPQILFQYTPWYQTFSLEVFMEVSKTKNGKLYSVPLDAAINKFHEIYVLLEVTKGERECISDDFAYFFFPLFSDLYFLIEQVTNGHQNTLKILSSFTKMGLICLVSGGLRIHLQALNNYMTMWKTTLNQIQSDPSLSTFFQLAKTIELILFNSQVIIRAMRHVESICIIGKTQQMDENEAFRYFVEYFVLSCPIRGKFSSYHGQLYLLSPDAIRLHLLINPKETNHYQYFQYYCQVHLSRNMEFLSEFVYYFANVSEEPLSLCVEDDTSQKKHHHPHHSLGKFLLHLYFPICLALCRYPLESYKLFQKLSEVLMMIKEKEIFSIELLNMPMNVSGKHEKDKDKGNNNLMNNVVYNNQVFPFVSYLFQFQRYLTILLKYAVSIVILKYLQQWPTGDDEQSLNDATRRYQLGRDFIYETVRKREEDGEQQQKHQQQKSKGIPYLSLVTFNNAFFEFLKCHEIFQIGGFFSRSSHESLTTSQLQQLTKWKNKMEKDFNIYEENVKYISIQQLFQFLELNYQEFRNHFQ